MLVYIDGPRKRWNGWIDQSRSSTTAEIPRDTDDVDFSVDDAHRALTLNSFRQTVLANSETAIQGHSRSSVVVPIDAAYMTSY